MDKKIKRKYNKKKNIYFSYEEAREWVIKNLVPLGIDRHSKWIDYLKGRIQNAPPLPPQIPKHPNGVAYYNNGWKGWGNFFGKTYILKTKNMNKIEIAVSKDFRPTDGLSTTIRWKDLQPYIEKAIYLRGSEKVTGFVVDEHGIQVKMSQGKPSK